MGQKEKDRIVVLGPKKIDEIRYQEYFDCTGTTDELYELSKNKEIPRRLMNRILDEKNICLAFRNLKKNKGSRTPGVDGKTIEDLMKIPEKELVARVRESLTGIYKPKPVRRVLIPKPGSDKMRPLGIPCIDDRLVQQCIKQILEPILEAKFYKHSYGFRPDRSCQNAISRCYFLAQIQNLHYFVDVDIKGFFDNVNHTKLMQQLWTLGIRDTKLLSIIKAMLTAEIVMPDGEKIKPTKGTPQGGIISPLLANVVLNDLDYWIASQWEDFPAKRLDGKEYASNSNKYRALKKSGLKEMWLVRYADDFKVAVPTFETAVRVKYAIEQWLEYWLDLETSPEKSKITDLKREYSEFLGIKFKLHKKGGKYVIESHMTDKAIDKTKKNLKKYIKQIQHSDNAKTKAQNINIYNAAVMGCHEYYSVATHISQDLNGIAYEVNRCLYNRVLKNEKNPKDGEVNPQTAVGRKYGKSKQMRYCNKQAIAPIGFGQFKIPFALDQTVNRFSEAGRRLLHRILGVNLTQLFILMSTEIFDRSIEYYDNRISKYCAQYGRCAVTGIELLAHEIHCHHIIPVYLSPRGQPDDSYENLVIVSESIHRLIHAREDKVIRKYMYLIKNEKQLDKLNELRIKAGREPIPYIYRFGEQLSFFDIA